MWCRPTFVSLAALVLALGPSLVSPLRGDQAGAQSQVAPQPPPPPHVESPGRPPNPNAVWISGHWLWRSGRYEWEPGRWETPPPGAAYIPGHHRSTGQGWVWEPGRWRKP